MAPMSKIPLEENALLEAIHNLTDVVAALKQTIAEDYPKRSEIERKYATKYGARRTLLSFVLAAVLAITGAYLFSIYTVSYCFLQSDTTRLGVSRGYCGLMPGYNEAVERNVEVYETFNDIVDTTRSNKVRIEKLEQKAP